MNIKTRFWIKLLYTTKYIFSWKQRYDSRRKEWLTNIKQHIASRRIGIYWRKYIEHKGEIINIRTVMWMRHAYRYQARARFYKPTFLQKNQDILLDFLRFKQRKHEIYSKMMRFSKNAIKVQNWFKKIYYTQVHRFEVLQMYWQKVKDTIQFLITDPRHK